jgi:spore coat polysaccharide biosynthesis predicted glycosyltransferase SpsG
MSASARERMGETGVVSAEPRARACVAFVTEGGADVGLGHVSRCLAVARAVLAEGARVCFVTTPDPRVAALLSGVPGSVIEQSWPTDPVGAVEALRPLRADAIVVDSYKAAPDFLSALRALASPVVAVDDTAERPLPVDVVVNGGVAAESLPYQRAAGAELLLGSRYALLDPRFADVPARRAAERVARIFVSLGGGFSAADLAAAVGAADAVLEGGIIDVAAGPYSASALELDAIAQASRNRVTIHRDRFGLLDLMRAADLAVTGAGMTLYELSATETPSVTVCMADNQRPNAEAFDRAGAARCAGRAGDPALRAALERALGDLVDDPAARVEMARRAHRLVDGRGATRVAERILRRAASRR